MLVFVGSDNPVKINATRDALLARFPDVQVVGTAVESQVNEQPFGDPETRRGAFNRARNVLEIGRELVELPYHQGEPILGVGLEGGVFEMKKGELWTTVWACVVDALLPDQKFEANGARFKLPKSIAEPILAGGEMGPVLSRMFGGDDIKRKQGGIGIVTRGFVSRTEEYSAVVRLALGLWYGREWEKELDV